MANSLIVNMSLCAHLGLKGGGTRNSSYSRETEGGQEERLGLTLGGTVFVHSEGVSCCPCADGQNACRQKMGCAPYKGRNDSQSPQVMLGSVVLRKLLTLFVPVFHVNVLFHINFRLSK